MPATKLRTKNMLNGENISEGTISASRLSYAPIAFETIYHGTSPAEKTIVK